MPNFTGTTLFAGAQFAGKRPSRYQQAIYAVSRYVAPKVVNPILVRQLRGSGDAAPLDDGNVNKGPHQLVSQFVRPSSVSRRVA